jgi:V/A-type H+-transporting ATPase subunit I
MLRPASTRWFEVLCPRAQSVRTVNALASTGAIEIEVRQRAPSEMPIQHLTERLRDYQALYQRYGRYWARGRLRRRALAEAPSVALDRALTLIAAWRREADPLIDILQESEEELTRLKWLAQIIEKIAASPLDFGAVARSGPVLGTLFGMMVV